MTISAPTVGAATATATDSARLPEIGDVRGRGRGSMLDVVDLGSRYDAVLRLQPPLTISGDEVDTVLSVTADALDAASDAERQAWTGT